MDLIGLDTTQLVITIVVVCLFLWRISYGATNGLFAEATGLIAIIAAFASVYYLMQIVGSVLEVRLGAVASKVGYFVVAFIVYKVMTAIADAFRKIKDIPIVGAIDRVLGAVLGAVEAMLVIKLVEYVTDIEIASNVYTLCYQSIKNLINNIKSYCITLKGVLYS